MTIIVVILFFRSVCLYLQNIVLYCYEKFLNPKQKSGNSLHSSLSASGNQYRNNRSFLSSSSSALDRARAIEREHLLRQIRLRKRAKLRN